MFYTIKKIIYGRRWDREFYKECFSDYDKEISHLNKKLNDCYVEINMLKKCNIILNKQYSSVYKVFKKNDFYYVVEKVEEENVLGGTLLDFYLHIVTNIENQNITQRLFAKIYSNHIYIHDIQTEANKGYGSILLQNLIEYAKSFNPEIQEITGTLSPSDLLSHGDRLVHFYTKNGFTITENKIKYIL